MNEILHVSGNFKSTKKADYILEMGYFMLIISRIVLLS